ncbi:amino acid adenylation domain-containing protein [Streptomyces sp. NBC_01314]|uniref:amino acid adenylation domain-containing protein n=1 Tax=Streptomyces sp. NBC_01314 TaxID=2903821 RepID=UPI00308706E5|nr:amino acid adenylation domain-containing protein [Streptomyces sp. NBC_01314]
MTGQQRSPEVESARRTVGAERALVLEEFNDTGRELPVTALVAPFEEQVRRTPDATALVFGTETLTYAEFNARANRLAHHLAALGVRPGTPVAVAVPRSLELLVTLVAVVKAGGAYLPLDPDYPADRLAYMLEHTGPACVVADTAGRVPVPEGITVVALDEDGPAVDGRPATDPAPPVTPGHPAYIIFTSGSTGRPKGVVVPHSAIDNRLRWMQAEYPLTAGDRVLQKTPSGFDVSVWEFFWALREGAAIVIAEPGGHKDPAYLARTIREQSVTTCHFVPSMLQVFLAEPEAAGCTGLRQVFCSGEALPREAVREFGRLLPGVELHNLYGPTEAAVDVTYHPCDTGADGPVPIGKPVWNTRLYVLDAGLRPCGVGESGELYLAGAQLASAYLGRPEITADRFLADPYGPAGERMYRTGDLARWTADGEVEYLGRTDHQIKLRGLRIELGEIESVLLAHPAVRQAAVVAHEGRQLVAYLVADGGPAVEPRAPGAEGVTADGLKALAAERLPEFMVPAAFVFLDALPLSPNGKLDRKALPAPVFDGGEYREPEGERERILAEVYAEVLGLDRVGADDDFLTIGGDSLRSVRVVALARTRGLEITQRQLLTHRTVARLAPHAGTPTETYGDVSGPLVSLGDEDLAAFRERHPNLSDVWPLTPMQSGMLFESMLSDSGYDAYRMQSVFTFAGRVDPGRMRAAGQALLDRHSALRAAFAPDTSGDLVQLVVDGVELPWRELDFRTLVPEEREAAFERFLAGDQTEPFDLATPPLLRMTLVRLGAERAALVLTLHHALLDGWSEPVLAQDLLRLYATGGDPASVPPVRGFRDHLAWLARRDERSAAEAWAAELAGVDRPTLLGGTAVARDEVSGSEAGTTDVPLTDEEAERLVRRAAELGVTLNTLVQGAWAVVLGRLTGRDDVLFGATVSGRPPGLPGVESMVGLFINTLPVRVRYNPEDGLGALLTGLQERQTELLDHHHQPLSGLYEATGLGVLFDTLLVYQAFPVDESGLAEASADARLTLAGTRSLGGSNYPLTLIAETDPRLRLTFQYRRGVFDEDTADRVATGLRTVLLALAVDPERPVGTLDLGAPVVAAAETTVPHPAVPTGDGAPPTTGQQALCALFGDVLGVEPDRIGVHDNFFNLGVTSLLATRLKSRIRKQLGAEVSIKTIFSSPTVAQLADHIAAAPASPAAPGSAGSPASSPSRPRLRRMNKE